MGGRFNCNLADCEVADKSNKKCKECLVHKKPTLVEAWAIKAPDGKFYGRFNTESEDHCIYEWSQGSVEYWEHCLSKGYRCVRVTVQEMQE